MSSLPKNYWPFSLLHKVFLISFPPSLFLNPRKETEDAPYSAPPENNSVLATMPLKDTPPPSYWEPKIHPIEPQVSEEVDQYFLQHWPFPHYRAVQKFRAAGFSRVTCCYFPEAHNDRIHFACRLLTLLFLVDDVLEDMSFEEGKAYNEKLIVMCRGDVLPDRKTPVQYIMYDLWESMRTCDKQLADQILGPVFTFMTAQTDPRRKDICGLGPYLIYREEDVGKALLSALMRFVMKLTLTPNELSSLESVEMNCAKHISVVNDIYSWEKELRKSKASGEEGSLLCSSVKIVADECNVEPDASKRILWTMCREWEWVHIKLVENIRGSGQHMVLYCKGLQYQMSGNELWSQSTERYHDQDT